MRAWGWQKKGEGGRRRLVRPRLGLPLLAKFRRSPRLPPGDGFCAADALLPTPLGALPRGPARLARVSMGWAVPCSRHAHFSPRTRLSHTPASWAQRRPQTWHTQRERCKSPEGCRDAAVSAHLLASLSPRPCHQLRRDPGRESELHAHQTDSSSAEARVHPREIVVPGWLCWIGTPWPACRQRGVQ